jgi:hypothetical protein
VPTEILHGIEESGMGPGAALDEFPEVPVRDRATDLADRAEAHVQVVLCEEALVHRDLPHGVGEADRAQAAALPDLGGVPGPFREQHPTVPRVLRVGGGVEQVTAQEHRKREHERMSAAEQVDRLRRIEAFLRRDDHADEIAEPIRPEQRHHAADRAHGDAERRHVPGASLPQVGVEAALDRPDEGHLPPDRIGLLRAPDRFFDILRGPRVIVGRLGEPVEHRPEVRPNLLLKADDLGVRDVHVAIDV